MCESKKNKKIILFEDNPQDTIPPQELIDLKPSGENRNSNEESTDSD